MIGSGRMDWLGQGGLALAMDWFKSSSSSSRSIPRPLLFRGQTATPGRREEGDVLGQEEEMLWGRPGNGNVLESRLQLFPAWLVSSNWRTLVRNGTETNKCFGPVVVVICGHTMALVTPLVLRVPLGKPCDWRQGTPCSHYDNIYMRSHQ